MKVLAQAKLNNSITGLQVPLTREGYQWVWWDETKHPVFDVFSEVNPDVFVAEGPISSATEKCLKQHPRVAYIIQSDIGEYETKQGRLVTGPLVDTTTYHLLAMGGCKFYKCDIGVFTHNVDDFIKKVCCPVGKFNVKIMGPRTTVLSQHVGLGNSDDCCKLFNSAQIVYTNDYLTTTRAIACSACCMTSDKRTSEVLGNEAVIYVESPDEFYDMCYNFTNNIQLIREQQYKAYHTSEKLSYTNAISKFLGVIR